MSKRYEWYMGTQEIIDNETREFVDAIEVIDSLEEENEQLKKELHYKNCECEKWKTDYENCSKLEKLLTKEHQYCLDNWIASEKDKIDFAIEQFEQFKSELVNKVSPVKLSYTDYVQEVFNKINNQINRLKEIK